MRVGDKYNWVNQPERLVYLGKEGPWHQFAKVESPEIVWCEVLDSDLRMLEETKVTAKPNDQQSHDPSLKELQEASLPDGKQCSDCANFNRCVMLFMCPADNTMCDWSPSKFVSKVK